MQFPVFLSPSDGAYNPPHGRSHPPLLYIMIIHYFPPLGFPSRFCPPFLALVPPQNTESKRKLPPPLRSGSPSSGPLPTLASPSSSFYPSVESRRLDSTARPGAGLAHIRRPSRCAARANVSFFTSAQSLMFSKVVVSFYSTPLTPLPPHHLSITCSFNHSLPMPRCSPFTSCIT
jgi:hypothetical protein